MIYTGVITIDKFGTLSGKPVEWADKYFQDIERDNARYKMIKSFSHYFTSDLINQFDYVFESEAEYLVWLESTDIVPTLSIEQAISDYRGMQRKVSCLSLPSIDFKRNGLGIRLGVHHFENGTEQKQEYREVELRAHNGNEVTGENGDRVGEYDYFVGEHINKRKTVPELIVAAIQLRDSDGTINKKCYETQ